MTFNERRELLYEFRSVKKVIPNTGGSDSTQAIEAVDPDVIAIGSDWARKDYYKQMGFSQDWLDERGIMLLYIPYTQGISTTELKQRIALN
jgi:glycerol-3-phosphate cytidylyltransferase